jgi:hypothetical protein
MADAFVPLRQAQRFTEYGFWLGEALRTMVLHFCLGNAKSEACSLRYECRRGDHHPKRVHPHLLPLMREPCGASDPHV